MPDDPNLEPTTDAEGQQNISPKGKAPASRVKDYEAAANIVRQLVREDEWDRQDRVNEQALLDGQGPFIQADLDAAGQSWRQNNDWGGASSKSEQAQAPYGELKNGFTVEFDGTIDGSQRSEYADIIGECWGLLHSPRIWRAHDREDQNLTRISVNFGVGIANFPHPRDFRWKAGGLDEHYFNRDIDPDEDAVKTHACIREYKEDELWEWLQNPNAEKVGFNKEAIKDAMLACNTSRSNNGWNDYESSLTNNVYGLTYSHNASVRLFTLRVTEMTDDGPMVSTCIGRSDGRGTDYLYKSKKPDWQNKMSDCFVFFLSGIGNGYLHSIKGLAHKIFNTEQTKNQFINQMYDFARLNMSPMFKAANANDVKKLSDITFGFMNVLPPGIDLVPSSSFPNYANSIIPLVNFSDAMGSRNTGVYQESLTPANVEQTREEVITRTMNNAIITSRAIELYQDAKERQYNISRERIQRKGYNKNDPGYSERAKFFEAMQDRGIENAEEVFRHVTYIKPKRQIGGGSAAGGQMLLKEAMGMLGFLDLVGQKQLVQKSLNQLLGTTNAKDVLPDLGIQRTTDQQHNAMVEDKFFFADGLPQDVLPDDDHYAHAQVHDAFLPTVYLQLGVQQDPTAQTVNGMVPPAKQRLAQFLAVFIPHQTNHLAALANNKQRSKEVGTFNLNLNKARQFLQHLVASAQAEQYRLAEAARAQAAKEAANPQLNQGVVGPNAGDQQKIAAKAQLAGIEITKQSQLAEIELGKQAAQNQAQLQHADNRERQARAIDDANNARQMLEDARQPLPNPVLQP